MAETGDLNADLRAFAAELGLGAGGGDGAFSDFDPKKSKKRIGRAVKPKTPSKEEAGTGAKATAKAREVPAVASKATPGSKPAFSPADKRQAAGKSNTGAPRLPTPAPGRNQQQQQQQHNGGRWGA